MINTIIHYLQESSMQQNVDQQEIEKFARLAAQWWDPNGDLKTLHQINPIRLSYILEKTPLKNQTILDVGCGGGILAESLAHHGARVTGIDMNAAAINVANLHQKANMGIEYLTITAEALTLERPAAYDIVTCFELLEHVPHPISIIKACYSIAKPGGHIFFSTLNRNIKSYLFAIIGAEYCLKLLPKNTHDFSKFIRPSEIATWIRDAGLQLNEFKGISYNIITQQFHLTNSISVNYLCHAKRP